jgi:hypothetical protein
LSAASGGTVTCAAARIAGIRTSRLPLAKPPNRRRGVEANFTSRKGAIMRWEYRIEPFAADDVGLMQDSLNSLGRDGWEVIAIVSNATGKDGTWPVVLYKRLLPNAAKPH